jgi:hypothetical protein
VNRILKSISLAVVTALLLTSGAAQGRPQENAAPKAKNQTAAAPSGHNTPGRIAKFTSTKAVGDSNITEDAAGKIGIGTTLPTSPLTVNGVIEMLGGGGIKFADGTLQTTAGLTTISRDATLKGDGTGASPLGLTVPLTLSGADANGVLVVSNTQEFGEAITTNGGPKGVGLFANGGSSITIGGTGVVAIGGDSLGSTTSAPAGTGVLAFGGRSNSGSPGTGISASGGSSDTKGGGTGLNVTGGSSSNAGFRSGDAIVAHAGFAQNGATTGLAARFFGNVEVNGTLSKFGGSFKIDHPLDPENKYLSHSFVESPDMMNIYNGNITTDNNGLAVVELPDYFESLNRDFRYQLTVVGQFAQAIVAEKVKDNRFTIQTSAPGVEVSWQVTGVRQDVWANKNRIQVEEAKSERERGFYLHPVAFGKDEERGVYWANNPELMREMKQSRLESKQKRPEQR